MDMHEEQNLQNSDEVSNTDNSVEQHATTSKNTSKFCKNYGPPMVLNPVTPDLVTPKKSARKKAKSCKRINSRKRGNGNTFVSETMQSNDSWLESNSAQNKDGKFPVCRKLNLNENSKLSSENPSTYSTSSASFSLLHKVYERRKIDNMKSQNLYRHPAFGFTSLCKEVEEKRCLLMPLLRSQMLKQQQNAVNGKTDCYENSAEYVSASMNFSLFIKIYNRRRIEREKSLPEIFTFAIEYRLITSVILKMLNSTLETSRAKLTNKRFEIPVQAFDLDKLEPNDVCNQLMAISTPMKTTQNPRKHRELLADVQSDLRRQELALVPYVHPLNTLEQKLPVVAFDPRNKWLWNCFASKEHDTGTFNDDSKRWWENERRVFQGRAESFLVKTRLIQGNRRFSKWKRICCGFCSWCLSCTECFRSFVKLLLHESYCKISSKIKRKCTWI